MFFFNKGIKTLLKNRIKNYKREPESQSPMREPQAQPKRELESQGPRREPQAQPKINRLRNYPYPQQISIFNLVL